MQALACLFGHQIHGHTLHGTSRHGFQNFIPKSKSCIASYWTKPWFKKLSITSCLWPWGHRIMVPLLGFPYHESNWIDHFPIEVLVLILLGFVTCTKNSFKDIYWICPRAYKPNWEAFLKFVSLWKFVWVKHMWKHSPPSLMVWFFKLHSQIQMLLCC